MVKRFLLKILSSLTRKIIESMNDDQLQFPEYESEQIRVEVSDRQEGNEEIAILKIEVENKVFIVESDDVFLDLARHFLQRLSDSKVIKADDYLNKDIDFELIFLSNDNYNSDDREEY